MLSKDDVLSVAKLSRLQLSEDETQKIKEQLSGVLNLFEQVKNIDVDGIAETSQVNGLENVTRQDVVKYDDDLRPGDRERLLSNVPVTDGPNIVVPKIIDSK